MTIDDVDAIVEELGAKDAEIAGETRPIRPWHADFLPTRPAEGSALLWWIKWVGSPLARRYITAITPSDRATAFYEKACGINLPDYVCA